MVSSRTLCLIAIVAFLGVALIPQEVSAGRKKMLIGYLLAKSLKPRFVPIPLPLPFPIKFKKDSHAKYPVHSYGGGDYGGHY